MLSYCNIINKHIMLVFYLPYIRIVKWKLIKKTLTCVNFNKKPKLTLVIYNLLNYFRQIMKFYNRSTFFMVLGKAPLRMVPALLWIYNLVDMCILWIYVHELTFFWMKLGLMHRCKDEIRPMSISKWELYWHYFLFFLSCCALLYVYVLYV